MTLSKDVKANMESDKSYADRDKEAAEKYNRILKKSHARELRMIEHSEWRGGKYPPMNIQPFQDVRQRLVDGMTDSDRALRKQWVMDQQLSPNEPLNIPELKPKNPIRRMLGFPWDVFCKTIEPLLGARPTHLIRYWTPKYAVGVFGVWAFYYHVKYNGRTWEETKGWNVYGPREHILPGDPEPEAKAHNDFYDLGFKKRTALRSD